MPIAVYAIALIVCKVSKTDLKDAKVSAPEGGEGRKCEPNI